jgi:hypothetical protein
MCTEAESFESKAEAVRGADICDLLEIMDDGGQVTGVLSAGSEG